MVEREENHGGTRLGRGQVSVSPQGFPNERIPTGPAETSFSRCSQGQLFIDPEGLRSSDSGTLFPREAGRRPMRARRRRSGGGFRLIFSIIRTRVNRLESQRALPEPVRLRGIRLVAYLVCLICLSMIFSRKPVSLFGIMLP